MFNFSGIKKNLIKTVTLKVAAILAAALVCVVSLPICGSVSDAARVKKVVIGYYDGNESFQNGFSDSARKTGYAYEYYQELLKYTNWRYEYYYGTADEIQKAFAEGKVDIMAGIPKTDMLQKRMLFANTPMGAEGMYIYCHAEDHIQYGKPLSFAGQKLGYLSNNTTNVILDEYLNTLITKVKRYPYYTETERNEAFDSRKVKLVVASDNYRPIDTKPVVKIGTVDYYFVVNPERSDILNELNIAQTKIVDDNPSFVTYLQQKYYVKDSASAGLDSGENQYISKNNISIGTIRNYMPYSDCSGPTDKPLGLIKTIKEEMEKSIGKSVDVKFYDSYPEMVNALKNNEVSCIFPVSGDVWSAEKDGMILTQSIADDRMTLFFKGEYNHQPDAVIATPMQSAESVEYLQSIFGDRISIKVTDSVAESIHLVENGSADVAYCGSNSANRYLSEKELDESIQVIYTNNEIEYRIGVPEDQTKLYAVMRRVISMTDESVFADSVVVNSYVRANFDVKDFFKHYSSVAVGILFTITIGIALITISRNRSVRKHNIELSAMNEHLSEKLDVIRRQKGLMRMDSLTQVNNRFSLEEYLNEQFSQFDPYGKNSLFIAVMDLDHFKPINDTYGHAEGDNALVVTARALQKACTGTSVFLARYGGDEFVMACEADSREYFISVLERIQPLLDEESFGRQYKLVISIGAAEHKNEKETPEEFFKRADHVLYLNKEENHAREAAEAAKEGKMS